MTFLGGLLVLALAQEPPVFHAQVEFVYVDVNTATLSLPRARSKGGPPNGADRRRCLQAWAERKAVGALPWCFLNTSEKWLRLE
jgi:hypothetical protein